MTKNLVIKIDEKWKPILGEELPLIEPQDYVKLGKIISLPKLSANEIHNNVVKVLPYIRQKVKMWGVDILNAENFNKSLINHDEEDEESYEDSSESESEDEKEIKKKNRLSRFDCIATLFASAECTVVQDIFRTISKFSIAIPLLMPELNKSEKYQVMYPLLTGPIIKWETGNGSIIENHLFKDPFKMIAAVRIGTGSKGKSSIINHLMKSNYMFTSRTEPRAKYGISHMVRGSIEFIWLTEETCGESLWSEVFKDYYEKSEHGSKSGGEIVLLANLHGEALDYPDQVEFLKQFSSCFLVYLMPEHNKTKFENLINPKKAIYIYVDPKKSKGIEKKYIVKTNSLDDHDTIKKMCKTFNEALVLDDQIYTIDAVELKMGKTLQFAGNTEFVESEHLINFIKDKTCLNIKRNVMQLQKKQLENGLNHIKFWQQTIELQTLIRLFTSILALQPINKRRQALAHLERELWEEVDNKSLGFEHFFRESGHIYKIFISDSDENPKTISVNGPPKENVLRLPEYYAELLISGNTIELLDGDSITINEAWLLAICNCIDKRFPKLRVYVISILGLQSSGKSTLLNALFACKFAVSVGRCTRGLFMRLLFLEKDLSNQLDVDAFILIDTEGLGAPEKMEETESEKKDRMLATFAMGISNLTIINVLGESMNELTEILQIAIVTMARLEKVGISPDIIMVQHVPEKNVAKLSEPEQKFRNALQKALKIVKEKDGDIGSQNLECLDIIDSRIKNGKLLKLFSSFKDGATIYSPPSKQYHKDVISLYNSIIGDCENQKEKKSFSDWYKLIKGYWDAISHEDFALRFKDLNEINEFIKLDKQITMLKGTIDIAFSAHKESIKEEIRSVAQKNFLNKDSKDINNDLIREKCHRLIENELNKVSNFKNPNHCEKCKEVIEKRIELDQYLEKNKNKYKEETNQTIDKYIDKCHDSIFIELKQMLEAILMRNKLSNDHQNFIDKQLENVLKMRKEFSNKTDREQEANKIWKSLYDKISISLKNNDSTIDEKIQNEVFEVYRHYNNSEFWNSYYDKIVPDLSKISAYELIDRVKYLKLSSYLDSNNITVLKDKINSMINQNLSRVDHFRSGIVRELKGEIDNILNERSAFLKIDIKPKFKMNVHVYALLHFIKRMVIIQNKWDKDNTPLGVLNQKKDEYLKKINIRLQYGHSHISEGHIAGDFLLRAIQKKSDKCRKFPRTVRLKYFIELAEQVHNGNLNKGVQHFLRPRGSIEEWFKSKVNLDERTNQGQSYKETFDTEFNDVRQKIHNCRSYEDVKKFLNQYMIQVDGIEYQLNVKDSSIDENFTLFREAIEKELDAEKELNTRGNGSYQLKNELLKKPSDDNLIMNNIGCTAPCPWCGALCWGVRGHEISDVGMTKIHHTSHQPPGLNGVSFYGTNTLTAEACHNYLDESDVYLCGKSKKWKVYKTQDYPNWKFETHSMNVFNDIMRWFFQMLHNGIAQARDLKPADITELKENGCFCNDYNNIISVLKQEFD
ncbi:2512_t:CDS:2 [Cetraspora pellucida]|uniref:2512_t:CDS:1 n=1 Tax=Cetraspora pellucida TaxID=1433469 RepID=A0A9N8VNP6_9GLOM|nr:2512_t:CDS:2 [Cetraspora pellucida]